jgi:hypothetical protein
VAKKAGDRIQIRNSTNDFLVFANENGGDGVNVLVADESVWLTQKSICALYETSKSTVSEHLMNIFASKELDENSVVRKFRTTAGDGKMYTQKYYNLQAIIAVGFKVNSEKAVRFRAWAADVLAGFALKGYVLDKERLKNDRIFSQTYFEHLLEDIREIRLSERKFYQKITDIYTLSYGRLLEKIGPTAARLSPKVHVRQKPRAAPCPCRRAAEAGRTDRLFHPFPF